MLVLLIEMYQWYTLASAESARYTAFSNKCACVYIIYKNIFWFILEIT